MAQEYFSDDRRVAWLQEKKGMFSASESWKILDKPTVMPKGATVLPMFTVAGETYIEEMAIEEYTLFDSTEGLLSKAMKDGLKTEPEAYQYLIKVAGLSDLVYHGDGNPKFFKYGKDAGASPDSALYKPDGSVSMGAEFKCPSQKTHWEYLKSIKNSNDLRRVDSNYWCQVQFTMMVLNCDLWLWESYNPYFPLNQQGLIIEVPKDDKFVREANLRVKEAGKRKWAWIERAKNNFAA